MSSKVLQSSPSFFVQDSVAAGAALPLAVLRLVGADAAHFLQGQVTQDVLALPMDHWTRAALCTAQGRILTLLKVVAVPEGLWLVLPAERVAAIRDHLQRFVLRAKVKLIADDSVTVSTCDGSGNVLADAGQAFHPVAHAVEGLVLPLSATRQLCLSGDAASAALTATALHATHLRADAPASTGAAAELAWPEWLAACVADGEPEVFNASAESWTPHMLAQEQWQAISLTKGCYTGQEIVARTHYLGKNKRRLEQVTLQIGPLPAPGEAFDLPDGRRADWVMGLARNDGLEGLVVTAALEVPPT
jgi:folate-binding protein YgfZ